MILKALHGTLLGTLAVPREPVDVLDQSLASFRSLPAFGTLGLYAVLVTASIAFALAIASSKRPRLLVAARNAAYATSALIVVDLLLLTYAFVAHDYRIRYVARYSDRSMPLGYLLTSLWGGQDGSLLWWLFLLSINTSICLWWMKERWRELQPYVIATLMAAIGFFVVIMAFSANPFSESIAGARPDGEGLNPQLQNFYMIIHPPMLYLGFVGCAVPFAFAVAALASGRLGEDWLYAVRRWMLVAWVFLSVGNVLGMLWAYEELGWGGYWAWDPVENAAFMPWLTASAFVHSIMIQERRRMLKIWNVLLIAQTFFMTIFGTFLTRSGMIASVHAFAQSSIGIYFTYFMQTIAGVTVALLVYRLPELRNVGELTKKAEAFRNAVRMPLVALLVALVVGTVGIRYATPKMGGLLLLSAGIGGAMLVLGFVQLRRVFPNVSAPAIDSVLSREAAFVANNWVLLGMQVFVLGATTFPLITESVTGEKATVGPAFFTQWMTLLGLVLFALMGLGPLFGWRKTSQAALRKAFEIPLGVLAAAVVIHVALGKRLGFPAVVDVEPIYSGSLGAILKTLVGVGPVVCVALAAFNVAVVAQEYWRGTAARMRANEEGFFTALNNLVARSRRRYGGYVVHLGIVAMFIGFTGAAYKIDQEFALRPGEVSEFAGYQFKYVAQRTENDPDKRRDLADLEVKKGDRVVGQISPGRFFFTRQQMPTTNVAILRGLRDDLYVAVGSINPQSKLATLHVWVNPLVSWIWIGSLILLLGSAIALWPDAMAGEVGVTAYLRTAGATAASVVLGIMLAMTPTYAHAQQTGSAGTLHAGEVKIKTQQERVLFEKLLCMCGTCARLPLSSCACGWADDMRVKLSARLLRGDANDAIVDDYAKEFGTAALNVPPSRGFLRSVWLVPAVLMVVGGAGAVLVVRKWARPGSKDSTAAPPKDVEPRKKDDKDDYDARLDAELKDLDG